MQNWGSRCFFLLLSLVICGCDRSSKCTERKHSLYFKYVLFHQPTRHGGQESVMQQRFYLGSELHVKWKCHCLKAKRASLWPTEEFDLCSAAAVVQVSTRRARILLSSWVTMFIYEGFHHGPKISKTNIKMKVKIKVLLLICFYSSKCTKKMHWHSKQEILEMKQKKYILGVWSRCKVLWFFTSQVFPDVTILFSDVVKFNEICIHITPMQVVDMLNEIYIVFDTLSEKHNVYKVSRRKAWRYSQLSLVVLSV